MSVSCLSDKFFSKCFFHLELLLTLTSSVGFNLSPFTGVKPKLLVQLEFNLLLGLLLATYVISRWGWGHPKLVFANLGVVGPKRLR